MWQRAHCRVPRALVEVAALVEHEIQPVAAGAVSIVAERCRPTRRVHDVARGAVQRRDPLGNVDRVGHGRRQQHESHGLRQKDERLLDHPAARTIAEQMHFIDDQPLQLAHERAPAVQDATQDLGRHYQARAVLLERHVARNEADAAAKLEPQVLKLLIRQRFNWRAIHHTLPVA